MKLFRLAFMVALVSALPLLSFAATKKTVTISDPTTVGGTLLKPGEYQVIWSGTGPNVQVNFEKNSKTVATAQASVKEQKNPYDNALELKSASGNTKALSQIDFKNESLVFQPGAGSSGE